MEYFRINDAIGYRNEGKCFIDIFRYSRYKMPLRKDESGRVTCTLYSKQVEKTTEMLPISKEKYLHLFQIKFES